MIYNELFSHINKKLQTGISFSLKVQMVNTKMNFVFWVSTENIKDENINLWNINNYCALHIHINTRKTTFFVLNNMLNNISTSGGLSLIKISKFIYHNFINWKWQFFFDRHPQNNKRFITQSKHDIKQNCSESGWSAFAFSAKRLFFIMGMIHTEPFCV